MGDPVRWLCMCNGRAWKGFLRSSPVRTVREGAGASAHRDDAGGGVGGFYVFTFLIILLVYPYPFITVHLHHHVTLFCTVVSERERESTGSMLGATGDEWEA